jgi:hypothetical protein
MERLGMRYSREQELHGMPTSVYEVTRDAWFRANPVQPG